MERGKPFGLKEDGLDQPQHCLAYEQQGLPHLASSLLGHMVAVSGLQFFLLAGCPVLPGQVPHSPLVLEFPALMAAQLHIPEEDLLISQLRFQVLQLLPLPLRQVFSARLLPELRDLGQGGQSNPHPTGAATQFPTRGVWETRKRAGVRLLILAASGLHQVPETEKVRFYSQTL